MKRSRAVVALILALIVVSSSLTVNVTLADPAQPHGVISLTFDDGWQNQYDNAFPLLQARGMVGTFYVVTSKLSNNPTGTTYMTYPELQTLQNAGCEIGSHSVTHPDFTTLTESQIRQECQDSKTALQSHGLTVNNFAYPWGAYNGFTDPIVADYYRSARDVYNPDVVLELPYLDFHLPGDAGDNGDPGLLSSIESIVDQVYSTNKWAVIYFHQVIPNDPNSPELINTQTLASFLDYIKSKGVPTVTVNQALDLTSPPVPPPSVTISPTSIRMNIGQSRTFSSSISGGNPAFSYQWYLNNSAVSGATDNNWIFTPPSTGNYGVYLIVTDGLNFNVQSNIVTDITVNPLPTVTINPTNVKMTVGTTQTFSGTILGGTSPYTYQWYYTNGTAIAGATTSTLSYKANSTGTINIYLKIIDSLNAIAQSNTATITVYSQPTTTINPTSVNMTIGTTQQFTSITTGGLTPYTYQWYYTNGTAITGATTSTLTYKANSTATFNIYLKATDNLNAIAQSNTATINVYSQPSATITPATVQMTNGTTQTFTSTVTGGLTPYAYQWYYTNGTTISGATTSTLAFKANQTGIFSIYLNVTDSLNAKTQSNTATITVYSQPSVTITPTNVQMTIGTTQTFTSTFSGGLSPYTYQWYYSNGTAISGATASTLAYKANSTGTYNIYLKVTDNLGAIAQSNTATITVYSLPSATIAPTSVQMTLGTTKTFTSTASGGLAPYTYQWYYTNGTAISTATTSTLTFKANQTATFSIYLKVTDNLNANTQSNTATITIYTQPSATIAPTTVQMTIGTSRQFTSTTTGGLTPYSYQWYLNDSAVSAATSSIWTFTPATTGHYKVYLNVTDALSYQVQSNIVTDITVNPQATVTINPTSVNMTVGGAQTFSSSATGGTTPYSYQWYMNNTAITGANNPNYTFTPTTAGTYNIYLNTTDNSLVTTKSNTATAKVETPITVNITVPQTKMYTAQTQTLTSTITGGTPPYTYQWYQNDTAISGATNNTYTFTAKTDGNYKIYLNITDAYNFTAQSNTSNILVCSAYLLLTTGLSQSSYSKGQSVTFTVDAFNKWYPSFGSSLTLTVKGPNNYGYFDVQPISVPAGTVRQFQFNWVVPNVAGTYIVEIGLAPAQLTAYDTAWIKVT